MIIKNQKELEVLREGGKKLAAVLNAVSLQAIPGITARELDQLAEKLILETGGKPSFKNYKTAGAPTSYPGALCISINEEIVHGLPTNKLLKAGDIVGLDIGMQFEELFTDTAVTVLVGNSPHLKSAFETAKKSGFSMNDLKETDHIAAKLITATKKSLEIGIAQVHAGARIGDIGSAIQKHLEENGFGVIRELVGHGVGRAVHEDPEIPNWGKGGGGVELIENQVIAIEPMAVEGGVRIPKIKIADDGWTWLTRDNSRSAHFEHTLVVTKFGAEILTKT